MSIISNPNIVPAERLKRAYNRIKEVSHWCQNYLALSGTGTYISPTATTAAQWCALGALLADPYTPTTLKAHEYLNEASDSLFGIRIGEVNDKLGHDQVLAAYQLAIKIARQG